MSSTSRSAAQACCLCREYSQLAIGGLELEPDLAKKILDTDAELAAAAVGYATRLTQRLAAMLDVPLRYPAALCQLQIIHLQSCAPGRQHQVCAEHPSASLCSFQSYSHAVIFQKVTHMEKLKQPWQHLDLSALQIACRLSGVPYLDSSCCTFVYYSHHFSARLSLVIGAELQCCRCVGALIYMPCAGRCLRARLRTGTEACLSCCTSATRLQALAWRPWLQGSSLCTTVARS